MAEDVTAPAPAARPAADRPAATRADRAHASAYYTRFSLAYTILAMLAVGGIGALVLILQRPDAARSPRWSTFVPTGSSIAMERQIATQVSSEYKESTASKLVTVFPGVLQAPRISQTPSGGQTTVEVPITLIAVQPAFASGQHEEGQYTFYNPSSTVAYDMCGFGDSQQNCGVSTITGSNPTQLLHREALELALYTLKYVPGTDAVVTYLPADNPQATPTAVLIARKDVASNLHSPLARTIKPEQAILGAGVPNAGRVAKLTSSRVYTTGYQTLPSDGSVVLVLSPPLTGP